VKSNFYFIFLLKNVEGANVVGPRANSASPASHVQWYYPAAAPQAAAPASPFHHQHHHQPLPFYG